MKKQIRIFQKVALLCMATALLYSCSDDKNETVEDNLNAAALNGTDIQTVLQTDATIGVADNLLASLFVANSNTGKSNDTNDCYTRENTDTGYILTFTGCILEGTPNVRGVIEVGYNAESQMPSYTATYTDFYIGAIKIDGTRTFLFEEETNGSYLTFSITSAMDLVLEDGTSATENGTRFFGFITGKSLNDFVVTLAGSWNLTVGNDAYTVTITDTLKTTVGCAYIAEGEMSLDKNGLSVLVDFGDGTCNDSARITYPDGTIKNVSLSD